MSDEQMEQNDERIVGELAAWRDLVQSEGYRLLREYLAREWGPVGYAQRISGAAASALAGDPAVLGRLVAQIEQTAGAVNEIAAYPTQRIRALEAEAERKAHSRSSVRGLLHRVASRGLP